MQQTESACRFALFVRSVSGESASLVDAICYKYHYPCLTARVTHTHRMIRFLCHDLELSVANVTFALGPRTCSTSCRLTCVRDLPAASGPIWNDICWVKPETRPELLLRTDLCFFFLCLCRVPSFWILWFPLPNYLCIWHQINISTTSAYVQGGLYKYKCFAIPGNIVSTSLFGIQTIKIWKIFLKYN